MLALGTVTMLLGAVLAVFSINLKRTLACSSMSQIGFILTGIAMGCLLGEENALAARGALAADSRALLLRGRDCGAASDRVARGAHTAYFRQRARGQIRFLRGARRGFLRRGVQAAAAQAGTRFY